MGDAGCVLVHTRTGGWAPSPCPAPAGKGRNSLGDVLKQGLMLGPLPPAAPVVRLVREEDGANWVRMLETTDPMRPGEAHAFHVARYFWTGSRDAVAYIAEWGEAPIGFIEVTIRACPDGSHADRMAWIEEGFVAPHWRSGGVAAALLAAGERWAAASGCRGMGMHAARTGRTPAFESHERLGFSPAPPVMWLHKPLGAPRTPHSWARVAHDPDVPDDDLDA